MDKATKFNFCMHVLSIDRNKSPLQISGKVAGCVVRTLKSFQGTLGASRSFLCDSSAVLYLLRWFTCQHKVTHPSTNWARCRASSLINTNALTTAQGRRLWTNVLEILPHAASSVNVLYRPVYLKNIRQMLSRSDVKRQSVGLFKIKLNNKMSSDVKVWYLSKSSDVCSRIWVPGSKSG